MSPGRVSGDWGVAEPVKLHVLFWGIVVGRLKCIKIGWPSKE